MIITAAHLQAYADASDDHNPIHLDESVARARGLPGVIAHGMLSAGLIGEWAVSAAGSDWRLTRFQTRFKAMVLLGDDITVSGARKDSAADSLVFEINATNQRGEVVTSGTAEFTRRATS